MYVYSRIADGLEQCLPSLETVVLVNNNLEELVGHTSCMCVFLKGVFFQSDLDSLASIPTLTYLRWVSCAVRGSVVCFNWPIVHSLLRNPVTHKPSYRLYVIHKMPQLRVLDFKRIRQKVCINLNTTHVYPLIWTPEMRTHQYTYPVPNSTPEI